MATPEGVEMRLRRTPELEGDPRYAFMVGRLVEASQMVALLLINENSVPSELQDVGRRLQKVSDWFLTSDDITQRKALERGSAT